MDTRITKAAGLVRRASGVALALLLIGFHAIGLASPEQNEQERALGLTGHSNPIDDKRLDALRGQGLQAAQLGTPVIGVILWDEDGQTDNGGQSTPQHGQMNLKLNMKRVQ